jgi:hypothetical protein
MRLSEWLLFGAAPLMAAEIAYAHHSRSVYDLETEVTLSGSVTRYEWINPHVYIYLETEGDEDTQAIWEIEASPPSLMRRRGWTRDTLAEGDIVTIRANPATDRNRAMALGVAVETRTGVVLDMLESASFANAGPATQARASSLAGTWLTLLNPVARPFIFGPTSWPLTPEGAMAIDTFEERMNPGRECIAYTAPFLMVFPDTKQIEIDDDTVLIRSEFEDVQRIVHMDATSHDDASITRHGHSIGRWNEDTLIVETERFSDHRMGNAFMLPSGPRKRLIEQFELSADGTALTYSFELSDPAYLTGAIAGEVQWAYRPNLEFTAADCDLENARRYLEE